MDSRKTAQANPSLVNRGLRYIGRISLSMLVIGAAAFAVQFGASQLGQRAEATPSPEAAPTVTVSTRAVDLQQGYQVTRRYVGQIEPQRSSVLSFELPGRLSRILADEGARVQAGQLLATQDTALLEADRTRLAASRTALEAQLTLADLTLDRSDKLSRQGFASQAQMDQAQAGRDELTSRLVEVDAALTDNAIRIEKSRLNAPFAGHLSRRLVDGQETLNAGQAVLELVALGQPQLRVGVPLDVAQSALVGAQVEVGGQVFKAELDAVLPDIDPVTRTRTFVFNIDAVNDLAFGQIAHLVLAQDVIESGLWLPITSLKEGLRGQWSVLVVDQEKTVREARVEIMHVDADQVFVRGAFPDGTVLIDAGPQRVTPGQRVSILTASDKES